MTLNELAQTLPNGFHDSRVVTIMVDYARRELRFGMRIWVGDLYSSDEIEKEAYRTAVVTLSGLIFCVIEPPDPRYPYQDADVLTIDTDTVESLSNTPSPKLPAETPKGAFTNWFFVQQWNSFIYVSAIGASLTWEEELDSSKSG